MSVVEIVDVVSPTNLLSAQPQMGRPTDTPQVKVIRALSRRGILVGTAESAALPAVYAATSPDSKSGYSCGPGGFLHFRGAPAEQTLYARAKPGGQPQDLGAVGAPGRREPSPA
jgi:hypothetical protein